MLGALAGDFVGSRFEFWPNKTRRFSLLSDSCKPTDDTVLTIAVADALAHGLDIAATLRKYTLSFPAGYGQHFREWAYGRLDSDGPYGSWGNGAAMRVSSAAWLATSFSECMALAKASAVVTHNHPEAVRGAQAVAASIYAGLSGWSRPDIRRFIEDKFGYDLSKSCDELMPSSYFALESWISVPKGLTAAFEAETVEEAIRNAVYLGGDADTEAAIAGSIAESWSAPPTEVVDAFMRYFPPSLRETVHAVRAKMIATVRVPLTPEEAERFETWDPLAVARWNDQQQEKYENEHQEETSAKKARITKLNAISDRIDGIDRSAAGKITYITRIGRWLRLI